MFISAFYSEGMGYSENSLPKSLASLGHDIHVITSDYNVYGNDPNYNQTYKSFLGEAKQPLGTFYSVGYKVHRLKSVDIFGYIYIKGLRKKILELSPDIVQVTEIASLNTFKLALLKPFFKFKLFAFNFLNPNFCRRFLKIFLLFFFLKRTYTTTVVFLKQ